MGVCLKRVKVPKTKIVELANWVDPDEVAHNEPPHRLSILFALLSLNSQFMI